MIKFPPRHRWVETQDGSMTLYSEFFQETCHSTTGAKTETLLHYIEGCKIQERLHTYSPFIILEVGFGLGLGFLITLEALKDQSAYWHYLSLELDRELLEWFREQNTSHPELKNLRWVSDDILEVKTDFFTLTVLAGDARKTLPEYMHLYHMQWHAIYQDAFSPRRNPVLWTKEWFSFLKSHSHKDAILSTYSASSSVRKSLHEAGWKVKKGAKFGPKRSSTRATLEGETDPEILLHLEHSTVPVISDDNLDEFLRK